MKRNTLNILLIYPNMYLMNMLPPAIALLSSILKQEGYNVDLFDTTFHITDESFNSDKEKEKHLQVRPFNLEGTKIQPKTTNMLEDLIKKVETFQPDLIAMSAVEDTFPLGIRLLNSIRHFEIPTILGGVFATFAPNKAIAYNEIDIVCVGEGENALPTLCRRLKNGQKYDDIPNLWVKDKDGSVKKNAMGPRIDINKLPWPDFTLFEEARLYRPMAGKVYRMIPFETHRGCPYQCTFCNSPSQNTLYKANVNTSYFRRRSMESVRREMDWLIKEWNPEYMYFTADTFLAWSPKEFDEFIETYSDYKLPFWCQTRTETLNEENIKKLKAVGLHRMSVGLEHGNEKFRRDVIKRNYPNSVINRTFDISAKYEVPISVNNIVGFPLETRDLAFDTIRLNREIIEGIDTANCYAFAPFHGTPLRDLAIENKYLEEDTIGTCLTKGSQLNMPQFSKDQIYGIMRTFNLYTRFPESRWPEIEMAEHETTEGNKIFEILRDEFLAEYYTGESVS